MWGLDSVNEAAGAVKLALKVETRTIVVAQGIQFNNSDLKPWPFMVLPDGLTADLSARGKSWPKSMRKRPPISVTATADGFEYLSVPQGVRFDVKIVNSKSKFRQHLLTPDLHVVYAGHARYGRGPCFGPSPDPGEDWENGTTPSERGLFRMGYPFIGIPAPEVVDHGYTVDLVEATTSISSQSAEPGLKPHLGSLVAKKAADIHPELLTRARVKDPKKKWWCYRAPEAGKLVDHVVIHAGWQKTLSDPSDLGATTPKCRVFCHFGCDTFKHNHKIVRSKSFKGWTKEKDEHYAYFTTAIADNITTVYWLYHLFQYSKPNAYANWGPSLDYAHMKVNQDLMRDGQNYRII